MLQIDIIRLYSDKKCLVIDDYPDIRASIKRMLAKFGANHVDTASNGEEAMAMCMKHSYDIILADYNLGEKKSGQQLLEEMRYRKLLKHSGIYLMITAEVTRDKVYSAIENQPDAYIAKPFTPPYLQKRLDALMIAKQSMAAINEAADNQEYSLAIDLCKQKIAENDKYRTMCLKMLGQMYLVTEQFDEALELYQNVLKERSLIWALIGLGKALMRNGQQDEAEDVFRSLIQQRCPCLEVYDCLAEVLSKKNKTFEAQVILEEAAELSSETILRQQNLAYVCELNDDLERAEKAHRKVVRNSAHSVYDEPDNYFNYVNCLNKISKNSAGFDKKRYEDANTALERVSKRFRKDTDAQLRARFMQSETAQAAGKKEKARELLDDAELRLAKLQELEDISPQVVLSRARALHANGEEEQARGVLEALAEQYAGNAEVTQAIDGCLDEPVSKEGKSKMVEFNREGKKLFEAKNFKGAVDYFNKALKIFPNHVALNLNLAMALLREMKVSGTDPIYLARSQRVLAKLSNLPADHQFYPLHESLLKQVAALGGENDSKTQ
jgi:DNA-binding response OmpR family regulator